MLHPSTTYAVAPAPMVQVSRRGSQCSDPDADRGVSSTPSSQGELQPPWKVWRRSVLLLYYYPSTTLLLLLYYYPSTTNRSTSLRVHHEHVVSSTAS